MIKFKAGGEAVPHDECVKIPADLIHRDEWIIDGFGCMASAWERFSATDTLIYVNPGASSGVLRKPQGLAREQSIVEQHPQQLSRQPALPPLPHSQIPAARRRRSCIKTGSPLAVPCRNPGFSGSD
jgi:hypothetical protein